MPPKTSLRARTTELITLLLILLAPTPGVRHAHAYDVCGIACLNALKHCPDADCHGTVFAALEKCRSEGTLGELAKVGGASENVINLNQIAEPDLMDKLWAFILRTPVRSDEERIIEQRKFHPRATYPVPPSTSKRCARTGTKKLTIHEISENLEKRPPPGAECIPLERCPKPPLRPGPVSRTTRPVQ